MIRMLPWTYWPPPRSTGPSQSYISTVINHHHVCIGSTLTWASLQAETGGSLTACLTTSSLTCTLTLRCGDWIRFDKVWFDFITQTTIPSNITLRSRALNHTASTSSLCQRSLSSKMSSSSSSSSTWSWSSGHLEEGLAAWRRPSCCFPHILHAILWQNVPRFQGWW